MWKIIVSVVVFCAIKGETIFYDSFYGTQLSDEEVKLHIKANTTFWCTNEIEPCDPAEGRRIDGSCNNLRHPTRGAAHTPFYRVLPAVYDKGFEPRKSKSGENLPLSRYLRTSLLSEGRIPDQDFTSLVTHYFVFMASDVTGPHDTVNYITWKPYCCSLKGKSDHMCAPNAIPADDPVHRFSDIRCFNMTRPISFQSSGCLPNNTTPERLDTATPLLDLSTIYGRNINSTNEKGRKFEGGLLKFDMVDGRVWPPNQKPTANICFGNQKPFETRCHATPDDTPNSLIGINLGSIWFWRLHNYIATEVGKINPCWDDERLFYTARDINIAIAAQIFYYELLPALMGRENMIEDGVLSRSTGFRDIYDETVIPQISLEYPYVLRWVHTIQEGDTKMYDSDGNYLKKFPIVNLTLRTGYLAIENNIDYITQGTFRQGSARFDHTVDPDIAEVGLGKFQRAADIPTSDLSKNRYFGFPSFIKYREHCFGKPYEKFDDLADAIDPERIERLRDVYQHIEDIDLMAGIWVEKKIEGGHVPSTFYCLLVDQLKRNIVSDRHWYERPNRPNAFSIGQLQEIRKASIAQLLCNVGDSVTHIQYHAFLRAGPDHRIGSCKELDEIDFWAWEDNSCQDNRTKEPKLYQK